MQPITLDFNGYTITTDKAQMKVGDLHRWLSKEAYWSVNIPLDTVQTAFDNSFCIGVIIDGRQIASARLITDYATFAYLADVYVLENHRGKGISKQMMTLLFEQDWVKGLRRIMLATTDAHGLYRQIGFTSLGHPEKLMEIVHPNIYQQD